LDHCDKKSGYILDLVFKESGRRGRQKGAKLRSGGACWSYLGLRGSLKWHLKPLENFECNDITRFSF